MRIVALLVALALSAGCQTKRQAWTSVGIGVGVAALGLLAVKSLQNEEEVPGPVLVTVAGMVIGGGVTALTSLLVVVDLEISGEEKPPVKLSTAERAACINEYRVASKAAAGIIDLPARERALSRLPSCGEPPTQSELATSERADARSEAWRMTKVGAAAARDGQCEPATRLASYVKALDVDFYSTVFVGDVAIARCLRLVGSP